MADDLCFNLLPFLHEWPGPKLGARYNFLRRFPPFFWGVFFVMVSRVFLVIGQKLAFVLGYFLEVVHVVHGRKISCTSGKPRGYWLVHVLHLVHH